MADSSRPVKEDVDFSEDSSSSLVITCAILLPLTWIVVGLRTYARAVLIRNFQIDDWCMLISQIIFTLTCAMVIEGTRRGLGKHNAAIEDPDDLAAALMWQALTFAFYVLDMVFVKLSIGLFLLRFAVFTVYKWILWISLVIFTLWGIGDFLFGIFQCHPVAKQWDYRIDHGHCAGPQALLDSAYSLSAMHIASDWLYALLPIPMVWSVQMTKQAKITVVAILSLGIFASVATLIRLKDLTGLKESEDLLHSAASAMVWTQVEPGVAIVASSLATIRPLLHVFHIRGFASSPLASSGEMKTSESPENEGYAEERKMSVKPDNGLARRDSTLAAAGISDLDLDDISDEGPDERHDENYDEGHNIPANNIDITLESHGNAKSEQ